MDLIVLNTNLDAITIIDTYESFIWTDRYYQYGDFELYASITGNLLSYLKQGYYLQKRDSDRLMIIEKILINSDIEYGDHVTVTGRSLESILDRRVIWGQMTLSGNLQDSIESLLDACIISPSNTNRKISNFIFNESTDPKITSLTISAQYTGDNLYDAIQKICEQAGIGFKVTLNDRKQFVFELYAGTDRSYEQTTVPYVIFSPTFDNVISTNYIESKSSLKNVALVGGEGEGAARRYTAVGNLSGLDRRELFVDARDISSDIDEDISSLFDFLANPSEVFNINTKQYVTDDFFNSAIADLSAYAGRTIRITIPKYTDQNGNFGQYATILLDSSQKFLSSLVVWNKYSDSDIKGKGSIEEYDILLPNDVAYIYTSFFSQLAINPNYDVYSGELTDFKCSTVKLSNAEYIAQLRQRGKEKLAENTGVTSFEGQMDTTIMYVYGKDFFEGDIVQIEDAYGHQERVRVLEVVTSENEEGISVYPTFTIVSEEVEETT